MILFFDTETTGFAHDNKPVDHQDQPHIVQLAAQLVTPRDKTLLEFSVIIDCGVPSGEGALNVHGISEEKTKKYGVSPETAVDFFMHLYGFADIVAAHKVKFDKKIMEIAMARRTGQVRTMGKKQACTMEMAKRHKSGRVNLAECMSHFFDDDHKNAHDAMADTAACRRLYFHLKGLED